MALEMDKRCCHQIKEVMSMALAMVVLAALNPGGIFLWIILGLLAGFLATRVVRGPHFGIIGDLVIGLVGAFLGGLVADFLFPNSTFHFWATLLIAVIGAIVLLTILRWIARASGRSEGRRRIG
jgi:uncharacterized membrane protein YeaQ/YmgE (transglycosylase-associated protein family)